MELIGFKFNNNNNNMEALAKIKWYKTTGGKIGIWVGGVIVLIGAVLAVRSYKRKDEEVALVKKPTTTSEPVSEVETQTPSELPVGVCGPVITAFDRAYNYVKCDNIWYSISKDKVKVSKWKSLADNKTASDLLNNKYPN